MQSLLTDIQYSLHPADVRIVHHMPQIRIEAFWSFKKAVAAGERQAIADLARTGHETGRIPTRHGPKAKAKPAHSDDDPPSHPMSG